ncbi:MAG: hypothetical protein RIT18_802 [Actinomycetota bacterium]
MSETNKELEPLSDPGLPEHVHRKTDVDPLAAKKAERQVSILFTLSALGTIHNPLCLCICMDSRRHFDFPTAL